MKKLIYTLLSISVIFGACEKKDELVSGCTDSTMFNFNVSAEVDDGSCIPFIFGCNDSIAYNYNSSANTEDESCIYSFINILTEQGDWIISTSVINPPVVFGNGEVSDYLTFTENCRKDDLKEFAFFGGLGTYTITEGATKCDPNDSNTFEVGDWTINSDSTIFYITPNSSSLQVWAINNISEKEFILEGIGDFQGDGVIRSLTNTFVHQ